MIQAQRSDGKWYSARFEEYKLDRLSKLRRFFDRLFGKTYVHLTEQEYAIMVRCGCVVRCPECKEVLNEGDHHLMSRVYFEHYLCRRCNTKSVFDFGPPVPILVQKELL